MPIIVPAESVVYIELLVPFAGDEGDAISSSVTELEKYLKSRYPGIERVQLWYRNPRPEMMALLLNPTLLHTATVAITVFNPFSKRIQTRLADDVYDWLKKRSKCVRRRLMGRKHSPKGQVVLKKAEKLKAVEASLSSGASDGTFAAKFKEMYPQDWAKIVGRYKQHERTGKAHPMPEPEKYLLNMVKVYKAKQR